MATPPLNKLEGTYMDRKALIAKKRKDKGFTLIELLIVIAILG
ncbi:MAG: prepilin-type N-terminal cleavage/methylation domain-containing protein, partial [Actinobacteria bacterium]|nr:prepilin-type N-terminal cleavage/methylation domain-containing protein [Actinomycetota bacterium]